MSSYAYTARNPSGQITNGNINATTREAASEAITRQGLKPILIKLEGSEAVEKKAGLLKFGGKIKPKDLVVFTRQLSTMVSAGVPLAGALSTLQEQTENKKFKQQLGGVVKDVQSGVALAGALEKYPGTFSTIYVNMVRAGEAGGILDDILKKLAQQQEKDATIRAKVKSATTYPLILLTITIIAFFVLTGVVVPKIASLVLNLGGPHAHLPITTSIMLKVSHLLTGTWIKNVPLVSHIPILGSLPNIFFIVLAMIIGFIYFRKYARSPSGKPKVDAVLLKIPLIKVIITKVVVARFARIFASLMAAGVSVLEALQVTAHALGNHVIEQELLDAAQQVKDGKQLSQPLSESKLFPPIVSQMLKVGEETGQTDTILVKVADFYEEEVDTVIDSLSSILEPVMIVVMGGMVGLIAISVLGPITSLNQSIGS